MRQRQLALGRAQALVDLGRVERHPLEPILNEIKRYAGDVVVFGLPTRLGFLDRATMRSRARAMLAEIGANIDVDTLVVGKIYIDEGPQMKRVRPAPQGRAYRILKRSSHVHIYLKEEKGS